MRYLSQVKPKEISGRALVRLDFNTEDEWRLRATVPTVKLLLKNGARVLVVSHRGRPQGVEKKLSLRKDAGVLSRLLHRPVTFLPGFDFDRIDAQIRHAPPGSVFLLENIRFLREESTPPPELAKRLARLADFYVNDAFAVDHRDADSVSMVERYLPSFAGLELEQEMKVLSRVSLRPARPLVLVIGGAKAHDKLGVLTNFAKKADWILLGGGAANTILKLKGVDIGASLASNDPADLRVLRRFAKHPKVILPVDWVVQKDRILDIGSRTAKLFANKIRGAGTVIWTGPLGLIENRKFRAGSLAVARAIVRNRRAITVTGGGETVMFLKKYGLDRKFSFISTGGSAMVDFLAGRKLPGIEALKNNIKNKK